MKSYDQFMATYRDYFADYTLAEVGVGVGPVRAFQLRKPGHGRAEGVDLLFTQAPMAERIIITGDLSPNDNQGCTSDLGYGIEWFLGKPTADTLCGKFLRKAWVPEVALEAMRGWLKDYEGEGEEPDARDRERAKMRVEALREAILKAEAVDSDGWDSPTHSAEAFDTWHHEVFHDTPETAGYGYEPREAALLVVVKATFVRLYREAEAKAERARRAASERAVSEMSEDDEGPTTIALPSDPTGKAWMHLAAELLDVAADHFGNHGCNDFRLPDWMSRADRRALDVALSVWNGSPGDAPREGPVQIDWRIMRLCAAALRTEAGREPAISEDRAAELAGEERTEALQLAKWAVDREAADALKAREKAEDDLEALLREAAP